MEGTFVRAQFRGATLTNVYINGSVVHQCEWESATISGGNWSDLKPWGGAAPVLPFTLPGGNSGTSASS